MVEVEGAASGASQLIDFVAEGDETKQIALAFSGRSRQ
jgi:hypothetical protein